MKKNNWLLIKILISIFISIILVLTCFYRYNNIINKDYITRSKKEAYNYANLNSEIFESRIKSIIDKIKFISSSYFEDKEIITEKEKNEFFNIIDDNDKDFNIYTIDEYNNLKNTQNYKDIIYIYNEKYDTSKLEVVLPIYNYENNIIGGISSCINENELNEFFEENQKDTKFSTYIFDSDGNILFGGSIFGKKNVFELYDDIIIEDNLYSKSALKKKFEDRKSFDLHFHKDDEKYYAFFNPIENAFYTLEIMPFEYVKEYSQENSRILFVVLVQVITIILVQILLLFGVIIIQNKKLIKTEIQKNRELDSIINSVPGGVIKIICDKDLKILFANEGFYELTGYSKEEYIDKFNNEHIHIIEKQDASSILGTIEELKYTKDKINLEYKIIKKDNTRCVISLTGEYLEDFEENPIYQCIAIDMTEYRRILMDLQIEKEQYDIISEMSDEIIFEYYINDDEIKISDKYKETFDIDFSKKDFVKNIIKDKIIHKNDIKQFVQNINQIKYCEGFFGNEVRVRNNKGEYNWALYQGFIIKDAYGNAYKIVGKVSNIDKFKKEIEELKEKSNRDPLTNVYNKVAIESIVNNTLNTSKEKTHVLFIIDIDNFKLVNDTFGHIFGDAVLKSIANNICKLCSKQDIIARIGGDEFVLFLQNVKDISYIDEMAIKLCEIFRRKYNIDNIDYKISASIGISIYPQNGDNYKSLLEKADIAVYHSKSQGKDTYNIYKEDMKHISLLNIQKQTNAQDAVRNDKRKSVYENVLINISEMFLEVKDMKATINLILATFSKSYKISRAYVLEVSQNGNMLSNTYEWCDYGINPLINEKQNMPFDEKQYLKAYNDEAFLYYENKRLLEENKYIVQYIYELDNIKRYFSCYFMEQGKIKGIIGFESYNGERKWNKEEIEGAFLVARLIGTQILKEKAYKKVSLESQINNAIIENQQLYTYIIKKENFEIVYFNEKVTKIIPNVKIGEVCYKLKGYDKPCSYCPIRSHIESLDTNTTKYFCEIADIWLGATYSKIKWIDGEDAYVVCAKDISEYIEQINHIDELTGIPSITKFKIQANSILNNMKNSKHNYALVYMDIDKFKYINDTFGYLRGDEVLKMLSKVIYENMRENEIFCRINDDKFLCIVRYGTREELIQRLKDSNKNMEEMKKEHFKDMKLAVICGVYKIEEDEDLNTIIDKANVARKTIKGAHKNSFAIYTKEMNESIIKEKLIEGRMLYALKNNEFLPYLQPKFDLNTQKVCGAEALVRWIQKDGEMIYPNDFIPIFEKNGFIINLDLYIYEKVFEKMREWLDNDLDVIPISLNVSRSHINNPEFTKQVSQLVEKYNIPIELIEFELTENIFSKDLNDLNKFIQILRKNGFKVSIDDFGSAYSSLNLLKEITVDVIKLDKGFLHNNYDLENVEKDKVIIEYIIKMAKELNLQVVCEGIETEKQIDFLKEICCEIGQGYIFSKPISIQEFEEKFLNYKH